MSEPLQNRSQKRVVFQHRFFRVLASISEGLGPPRWSQVRRAACSARRVRSHGIFSFGNPAWKGFSGGPGVPRPSQTQGRPRPCWAHVGTFFALGRIFFVLGWFLNTSCTFLAHVGRFFRAWGRCGLDFGWSGEGFGRLKTTFADEC